MEMKYLTEQDTGQIYLPKVHVTGIVDLDVSGNTSVKTTNLNFTDGAVGITRGILRFNEYNKVVAAQLILEVDYERTAEGSIYPLLVHGAPFTINISGHSTRYTYMVFDTVTFDTRNTIDSKIDTSITYSAGVLTVRSSLKDRNYYYNDTLNVVETPYDLSMSKVVGTAIGFAI